MCLTIDSDLPGDSGGAPGRPGPSSPASAKFTEARGLSGSGGGVGEQQYQVALDSRLGKGPRGTPGFKIRD